MGDSDFTNGSMQALVEEWDKYQQVPRVPSRQPRGGADEAWSPSRFAVL
jgi:hypothetical protein